MDDILERGPYSKDRMYLVEFPKDRRNPSRLLHTQIELDGKRVFVGTIEDNIQGDHRPDTVLVGLVVPPVY